MTADTTLDCGCSFHTETRDQVELLFLTPCSEAHREVAHRLRGANPGRSPLVVKAVPE